MDIFTILKKEHKQVRDIFEKISQTTERAVKKREELFSKLENEITMHTELEEKLFYSRLRKNSETKDCVKHSQEEHNEARELLSEIKAISVSDEEWLPKVVELQDSIEHHVKEEEGDLFPLAKNVLNKEEINQIGLEWKQEKEKLSVTAGSVRR